jgi:hypothetical protein
MPNLRIESHFSNTICKHASWIIGNDLIMRLLKSCVIDVDLIMGVYILGYIICNPRRQSQERRPFGNTERVLTCLCAHGDTNDQFEFESEFKSKFYCKSCDNNKRSPPRRLPLLAFKLEGTGTVTRKGSLALIHNVNNRIFHFPLAGNHHASCCHSTS